MTAINLRESDELIEVKYTDDTKDILLVTRQGMSIRFHATDVRASMGVIGMKLEEKDTVIGMQLDSQGESLLIVSAKGMGKKSRMGEFGTQNRGGKGIKCYKISSRTGEIVGAKAVNDDQEIMLITTEGIIIRINVGDISTLKRITSGVKLINMEEDITVASIAKVRDGGSKESDEQVLLNLESESEK